MNAEHHYQFTMYVNPKNREIKATNPLGAYRLRKRI